MEKLSIKGIVGNEPKYPCYTEGISNYKYNGKELQEEFGLNWYDYGARNYQADLGRWMNIDPYTEKYVGLSPYVYVSNMPIVAHDPDGKQIGITVEHKKDKDGNIVRDKNGNATITAVNITVTGKVINFSDNNVNMSDAIGEMKSHFEKAFSNNVDGIKINATFDFTEASSMEDVKEDDHLIVLAEPGSNNIAKGMANKLGGRVAFVDADYFTGIYDTSLGTQGEYTTSHEMGHLFGLEHYKRTTANRGFLMREGGGGNSVTSENYNTLIGKYKKGELNQGKNHNKQGLPNMGIYANKNIFKLTGTIGRNKKISK